ncbi:MAG: sigma-54-dependent Fis family transcriptional regulator [Deltaproteobacteria bacterium]|nr:sigma-54-dependent Fis family transcriptional regulator [Deltaproteobacteria bacterium]
MSIRTLIIEDDRTYARILERITTNEGFEPAIARTGEEGLEMAKEISPALVLCDIGLPGIDGIEVVRRISAKEPGTVIIVVSGQATVENSVEAMRAGAFDIIQKTSDQDEIKLRLHRAMEAANLRRQIEYLNMRDRDFGEIVGESPTMQSVKKRIEEVAISPSSTVLIVGDTGTGKELVARAVHRLSIRRNKPLIAVNCAAVPENLMESVFFGHEKGAFSGADKTKTGLFETASGSSLFLDEIGELDLRLQAKLLRAMEEKVITRVGGVREIPVDVRLITATNRDLTKEVSNGNFREDLMYRINGFKIDIPPLANRGNDILILARHFMFTFAKQLSKRAKIIDQESEKILMSYSFPGNVRQLRNLIEQAVILSSGDILGPDLFKGITQNRESSTTGVIDLWSQKGVDTRSLDERWNALEEQKKILEDEENILIEEALSTSGGTKTMAAKALGISRFALQRRLKKINL